jgi:hypothetical protein
MAGILTAAVASTFSGVTPDPYFEYTTLLLPGSGTNGTQNNSFVDSSANAFPITRNPLTGPNAPTQGTFSPFSQTGWGNYFDGNLDYLTVPDNAAFTLGNSDFCIELWINSSPSMAGYAGFFGQWANATTNCSYVFRTQTSQIVQFSYTTTGNGQTGTVVNGSALTTNSWNHLVVCRSGANLAIFQNGTRTATHNISTLTISDSTRDMQIGYSTDGGHVLGYMSNLRLVKGSSVYDPTQTTITVPTAPLTAITNTSLLTCQSNRFKDNSTNNFTITRNGDTRVVAFSPFNPSASWSAATYGGSGYFDGSGDYLDVGSNAALAPASGDFCLEMWVYLNSTASSQVFYGSATTNAIFFYFNGVSKKLILRIAGVSDLITSSLSLVTGQWYHVAVNRSGTSCTMWINGSSTDGGTATSSQNFVSGSTYIGSEGGASSYLNGYVASLRFVKGSSVYSGSTITVPTAPLTAITNTALLLNFTNAGIYDATSKNDLETVGNAQISTTQSKWGGSSMSFDGTGDYLLAPSNALYSFGTGVFTVECWLYINSLPGVVGGIVDTATTASSGRFSLVLYASGKIYVDNNTNLLISTSSLATGSWYHLAVVRTGTGTNQTSLYINGVQDKTATIATDFTNNNLRVGTTFDNYNLNGYIQDLRITRGYARYTANFTPPTAAFPTL